MVEEAFAIDRIIYRQFAGAIEDEILWRLRQDRDYMDTVDIGEVGERIGLDPETALGIFLRLAGEVWAGELLLEEEGPPIAVSGPRTKAPPWHRVASVVGFRSEGSCPRARLAEELLEAGSRDQQALGVGASPLLPNFYCAVIRM